MNDSIVVKCPRCNASYAPDLNTRRRWTCAACGAGNTNLTRGYKSLADLFILGLIANVIVILVQLFESGLGFGPVVLSLHAMLLLVTNILIYKSWAPWENRTVKTLTWTVFAAAFAIHLVLPMVRLGALNIPFAVVYAIVLPYLVWLHVQTKRCRRPA
jgi:ribosomal protein L37E